GVVEKTPRSMDYTQFHFVKKLNRFLYSLGIAGEFIVEGDTFYSGAHRRADVAFFTDEQIEEAKHGTPPVPQFVIEVISKNDQKEKVNKKMQDYRAAEVEIVWQVFPKTKEVHVFRGKQMTICSGDDVCSAEPVIPGFKLTTREIFE
ncbi:MAG: Uma2 family endonuclease, partial [Bacteroidota bacterium]